MLGAFAFALLQVSGLPDAPGQAVGPATASPGIQPIVEEELILFSIELDALTLTDSLGAYGNPEDPLIPVGELARLLDLDITASPAENLVTGRLGEARRALTVDIATPVARAESQTIPLSPDEVAKSGSEIYIRASALQKLLPITFAVDAETLIIKLKASEKLPIQGRLERIARQRGLNPGTGEAREQVLRIASPYQLFTPPAFDIALETAIDTRSPKFPRRFDIRTAADLLYMGFQGYVGSDETGRPATVRALFERRAPEGGLLGPLDATRFSLGDTFTPALPIGARSEGGRGFAFTTAPLEQASVFQKINLRGELPIGFDVELYINDILRSGQRTPVQGRYEFRDVPLVRGINVIRLVTYGPRGERTEQTRVINVGGGQLKRNELVFDVGVVEQEKPLFDLAPGGGELIATTAGGLRAIVSAGYGLTEGITLVAGAALYPDGDGNNHQLITGGLRTSLLGLAVQADAARDDQGGLGMTIGLAGSPLGVSTVARHAEYRDGFLDETRPAASADNPLRRYSEIAFDFSLPQLLGQIIPVSLKVQRDAFVNDAVTWSALSRTSLTIADTLVSGGLDYERRTIPGAKADQRLTGNFGASKFVDLKWQLRGTLDYDVLPDARFRSLGLTADRDVTDQISVRFGLGRSFAKPRDLNLQAGAFFRLPFGDIALSGDYVMPRNDWRIGLRIAFGLAFQPDRGYRLTRPGPANGASAVFRAFTDSNGNGRYDDGEAPVSKVVIEGGEKKVETDEEGRAFVGGLGTAVTGQVQVGIENIDDFYVASPPRTVEFSPRAGKVLEIDYPLAPSSEVSAQLLFKKPDGETVGLAALRVQLVRDGRTGDEGIFEATTEYDGTVVFNAVPMGTYRLELDPEQSAKLRMRLAQPLVITVASGAPTAPLTGEVVLEGADPAPASE